MRRQVHRTARPLLQEGGLVCRRHDDARDEGAHLTSLATTPASVATEPRIFSRSDQRQAAAALEKELGEDARADFSGHGFWERARTGMFDIRICDTDAKGYGSTSSEKILARQAKEKKDKYEAACIEQRRSFTPLVYSVDGMPCAEAKAWEKRVASKLAAKWEVRYGKMVNFVRTRMCLAIVRSNTLLLRGDRAHRWSRRGPADGIAFSALTTGRVD